MFRGRMWITPCVYVQKLVVFNHPSWADTAIMLYLFAPSGVSRASNSKIPVIGTIINSFQNIFVPSGGRNASGSDSLASPLAPQSTTSLIGERCTQYSSALPYWSCREPIMELQNGFRHLSRTLPVYGCIFFSTALRTTIADTSLKSTQVS